MERLAPASSTRLPSVPRRGPPHVVDDYRLRGRLARSAVADAFLATYRPRGDLRVLYVLRARAMQDRAFVARVVRAVDAARALHHSAFPRIDPPGETREGRLYVAVEHRPGPTLATLVASGRPLDQRWLVRMIRSVMDALDEAHAVGLVHGRLTPERITVTPGAWGREDGISLTGMGLALVEGAAPELDAHADAHADASALGAVVQFVADGASAARAANGGEPLENALLAALVRDRAPRYDEAPSGERIVFRPDDFPIVRAVADERPRAPARASRRTAWLIAAGGTAIALMGAGIALGRTPHGVSPARVVVRTAEPPRTSGVAERLAVPPRATRSSDARPTPSPARLDTPVATVDSSTASDSSAAPRTPALPEITVTVPELKLDPAPKESVVRAGDFASASEAWRRDYFAAPSDPAAGVDARAVAAARTVAQRAADAFARAVMARDIAALARVAPDMPAKDRARWAKVFRDARALRLRLTVGDVRLDGDVISASVRSDFEFTVHGAMSTPTRSTTMSTMTFVRDSNEWRMTTSP